MNEEPADFGSRPTMAYRGQGHAEQHTPLYNMFSAAKPAKPMPADSRAMRLSALPIPAAAMSIPSGGGAVRLVVEPSPRTENLKDP